MRINPVHAIELGRIPGGVSLRLEGKNRGS
jgi:uncharacterized protein YeaC (DUF1315 family)